MLLIESTTIDNQELSKIFYSIQRLGGGGDSKRKIESKKT